MEDLTEALRLYRECTRHVWNAFLRSYPDGEHAFQPVDDALFSAMVLSQLACFGDRGSKGRHDYYDGLRVEMEAGGAGRVLIAEELADSVRWREARWSKDDTTLCFRSLFDFVTFDGEWREFRYVDAVVVERGAGSLSVGQRLLLEADEVRLLDVSAERTPSRQLGDS